MVPDPLSSGEASSPTHGARQPHRRGAASGRRAGAADPRSLPASRCHCSRSPAPHLHRHGPAGPGLRRQAAGRSHSRPAASRQRRAPPSRRDPAANGPQGQGAQRGPAAARGGGHGAGTGRAQRRPPRPRWLRRQRGPEPPGAPWRGSAAQRPR